MHKINAMKIMLFILFLTVSSSIFSQSYNQKTTDEKTGNEILISYCNRQALNLSSFNEWFDPEYKSYQPNQDIINQLSPFLSEAMQIVIIFGTWCGDSKEQVPRFFKITDALNISMDMIEMIAVDRKKLAPGVDLSSYNIDKVPTFVIFKDGKEIGRIIETPTTTLESDLLNILKK